MHTTRKSLALLLLFILLLSYTTTPLAQDIHLIITTTEERQTAKQIATDLCSTITITNGLIHSPSVKSPTHLTKHPAMPQKSKLVKAYCERVVDGDTAWFQFIDEQVTHKVRFIGIDTPETVHPDKEPEYYGAEASAFTTEYLDGVTVYLEYDKEKTDKYDRQLCYVWLEDGALFNLSLLEYGYARVTTYPPNTKYLVPFKNAVIKAKTNRTGMWK